MTSATATVDGDGHADVVGFGEAGTYLSITGLGGFPDPVLGLRDFGIAQGRRVGEHPRELAGVNGDGRADIVGFGFSRTYVQLL